MGEVLKAGPVAARAPRRCLPAWRATLAAEDRAGNRGAQGTGYATIRSDRDGGAGGLRLSAGATSLQVCPGPSARWDGRRILCVRVRGLRRAPLG